MEPVAAEDGGGAAAEDEGEGEAEDTTDWSKSTCAQLRKELKSRGLETKGLKAALVERLQEADAAA